jgi:hypothetical protein
LALVDTEIEALLSNQGFSHQVSCVLTYNRDFLIPCCGFYSVIFTLGRFLKSSQKIAKKLSIKKNLKIALGCIDDAQ